MARLDPYRAKRDARRTPEPVPPADAAVAGTGDRFVIQEHHARALHWDFRLERDGVLVSWAVPKGLPLDRRVRRLAVHTEDHPLEYATFEGEIPTGEYGGGTVTVWDRGTYRAEKWTDDEVKVVLDGARVSGRYVLVRTARRGRAGAEQWMVQRLDEPTEPRHPPPAGLRPMLATARDDLPGPDDAWAFEFKWDGVRVLATVDGGRVTLVSRNGRDVTAAYPELRGLGEALGARQVVLDGEVVAFDDAGRPDFGRLQPRMHVADAARARRLAEQVPVTVLLFDLLYLDGQDTTTLPYTERRARLEGLGLSGPHWATPPWFAGGGRAVWEAAAAQGLEGVVAKRPASPYRPGRRSDEWVKVKRLRTQEVVVGGWSAGRGRRAGRIGALLVGVPDGTGALRYAGNVGTGFTDAALDDLAGRLGPRVRPDCPFAGGVPAAQARAATWVAPELVGEVTFSEWTAEGRLRQPSWRGLRPDKEPGEVRPES